MAAQRDVCRLRGISKGFCEEVGERSGIGISTNLGQDLWWEWLACVIVRVWWVGDEIIKFEKDLGSFFRRFSALRALNLISRLRRVFILKEEYERDW